MPTFKKCEAVIVIVSKQLYNSVQIVSRSMYAVCFLSIIESNYYSDVGVHGFHFTSYSHKSY